MAISLTDSSIHASSANGSPIAGYCLPTVIAVGYRNTQAVPVFDWIQVLFSWQFSTWLLQQELIEKVTLVNLSVAIRFTDGVYFSGFNINLLTFDACVTSFKLLGCLGDYAASMTRMLRV